MLIGLPSDGYEAVSAQRDALADTRRGMTPRQLGALFDPTSVAIIGASDSPAKWGYAVARQALRADDRRPVYLVNRRGGSILGQPAATSVAAIGAPVDLAVVCVPVAAVEQAVDDALGAGARAIVVITAGFAESGPSGVARQGAVAAKVRAAGALLVGPNCLGIVDNTTQLYLASDPFTPGSVALLSQSGNLALELELRVSRQGLGFSRFVSFGNQADVSLADLVADCAAHPSTAAIAIYAEDFADGRAFASVAAEAVAAGKPVVLLTAGAGAASVRAAGSHTGALTTPTDVIAAVARDAGIHQAATPRELVALLSALVSPRRSAGRRTAVLTDGGGHGALAADAAERAGLDVPPASLDLQARLRTVLWSQSAVANPVDLAGMGEQDPLSYAQSLAVLLADDAVDAVLMTGYFGGYAGSTTSFGGDLVAGEQAAAAQIVSTVTTSGKPFALQSMYPQSPTCAVLREAGLPVFGAVEDAALALAAVTGSSTPAGIPSLPAALSGVTDVDYFSCRRLLAAAGVPFPAAYEVRSADEVRSAVASLPSPYVLKSLRSSHKSDSGGVVLGLRDIDSVVAAYERIGGGRCSVEAMAAPGVELIAGVRWDARFGPVLLVGLGGIYAEVLRDTAFALAPVSTAQARGLLHALRGASLLTGARGRPPADVDGAAEVIARLSAIGAAHPEIAELECNPLLVTSSGALALDARAVLA